MPRVSFALGSIEPPPANTCSAGPSGVAPAKDAESQTVEGDPRALRRGAGAEGQKPGGFREDTLPLSRK